MNENDSTNPDREDASGGSDTPAHGGDAASPIDRRLDALTQAVEQITRAQQAIVDTLQNHGAAGANTSAAPSAASSSPADVRRIVRELFRERDVQHARTDARDRYVRTKMADLPDAYRRLMPETDDADALARAERDVRKRFREDLKGARGGSTSTSGADIAGDPAMSGASTTDAGERPGAALDYSKLSPLQQIALGLRGSRVKDRQRPGSAPGARQPSAGTGSDDASPDQS